MAETGFDNKPKVYDGTKGQAIVNTAPIESTHYEDGLTDTEQKDGGREQEAIVITLPKQQQTYQLTEQDVIAIVKEFFGEGERDIVVKVSNIDSENAANGYVIVADGNGNASWKQPFVVRETATDNVVRVYANDGQGHDETIALSKTAQANTIAQRDTNGELAVATPTQDTNATTKKYVDDLVADVGSLNYLGSVATYADLPEEPENKDTYFVEADSKQYTWNGEEWVITGEYNLTPIENQINNIINGSTPVGQAIASKSINAVSDESGAVQETPFIYQGTGTANGTASVDTSPVGKHLEKQGNTVVVNQLAKNNVATTTAGGITFTNNNNGTYTLSGIAESGAILDLTGSAISGHKYLVNSGNSNVKMWQFGFSSNAVANGIITASGTNSLGFLVPADTDLSTPITIRPIIIDLTQWFNGDIPQDLDHPENAGRYGMLELSYNTGTLVNADGRYLECGGRNVWDGLNITTGKQIDGTTGALSSKSDRNASDYLRVIPSTKYYSNMTNVVSNCGYAFYDKDKNYISGGTSTLAGIFTTPANAFYVRFTYQPSVYSPNNITISLYYPTGDGYDQYYPYEEPKVYDTGTETLRSAGSVKDYKTPDGVVHRVVDYVDLSTLSWTDNGDGTFTATKTIYEISAPSSYADKANAISSKYLVGSNADFVNNLCSMYLRQTGTDNVSIVVKDSSTPTGTLYYELATPTTEQGTTFAENIEINDYGTMGWKDTSGYVEVPQGCKIFYPADYVLFIDSLGQREDIEWTASEIVSQSELSTETTARSNQDTILQNAIGGTLRHCLAVQESGLDFEDTDFVDLGTLTWTYYSGTQTMGASITGIASGTNPKAMCSKYSRVVMSGGWGDITELTFGITGGEIRIKDTSLGTDATSFKNAMKGVLLAYEKASE